jgi:hypothetical protein
LSPLWISDCCLLELGLRLAATSEARQVWQTLPPVAVVRIEPRLRVGAGVL